MEGCFLIPRIKKACDWFFLLSRTRLRGLLNFQTGEGEKNPESAANCKQRAKCDVFRRSRVCFFLDC